AAPAAAPSAASPAIAPSTAPPAAPTPPPDKVRCSVVVRLEQAARERIRTAGIRARDIALSSSPDMSLARPGRRQEAEQPIDRLVAHVLRIGVRPGDELCDPLIARRHWLRQADEPGDPPFRRLVELQRADRIALAEMQGGDAHRIALGRAAEIDEVLSRAD